MKMHCHKNIAIFVPHAGCPYHCAFCNQNVITAQETLPHGADVRRICQQAMQEIQDTSHTEIAFFGGSFTAIPRAYMLELLEAAQAFIGADGFSGIRISTRPDCISPEILDILRSYHVTSIELGTQSMQDHVLLANRRGHTAQDVLQSSRLIQAYGFELGLQMMIGLYQSTWQDEAETVQKIIAIHPDTVRIYPIVVLKHTPLAALYQSGAYCFFQDASRASLEDVICQTAVYMQQFTKANIRLLKVGLHASEFVEQDYLAGYYHPAFRELCESRIYRNCMQEALTHAGYMEYSAHAGHAGHSDITFAVNPRCISKAIGQKRENIRYFQELFSLHVKIAPDTDILPFQVELR